MKIGFVSLGCPKNLVDSEVMLGMAEKEGHEITADAAQADVLVVNTCAFIDRAKQESIDTILEMAQLKSRDTGRRLIVTGCLAERYREELKKEIPEIDVILGTGEVASFAAAVSGNASTSGDELASGTTPLTFYTRDPDKQGSSRQLEGASRQAATSRQDSLPVFGVDLPT